MKLARRELPRALAKGLAPVYAILGEEPLEVIEARDEVRAAARKGGFDERLPLFAEAGFDWSQLAIAGANRSLFGGKLLLDLTVPDGKTDLAGSRALIDYACARAPDTLLLVSAPASERKVLTSAWAKALAATGVLVDCRPLTAAELPNWIAMRLRNRKLTVPADAPVLIAEYAQGNSLAAAQAVERLALLAPGGRADMPLVREAVVDEARYGLFDCVDAAIGGNGADAIRMLVRLQETGTAAPLVLWAIARELRVLESWSWAAERGGKGPNVWASRRKLVAAAARRYDVRGWQALLAASTQADRIIKGRLRGDPWMSLEGLLVAMAGVRPATAA